MYTCLLRGSIYDETVIVQRFDSRKIQGGLSGYLKQEFHDLELLGEIPRLRYIGKLNKKVEGITKD